MADLARMATAGGARALMLQDQIGTLEVGKRADIIPVDRSGPHMAPTHTPLTTLVMAAVPENVTGTIVDGAVLMRDRKVVVGDEEETIRKAGEHLRALVGRAGL